MELTAPQHRQSRLLADAGFRHAFFTRAGGVSEGPYATLNFSWAVGDDPAKVDENLRRAARALAIEGGSLYFLSQVHGSAVRRVHGSEDPKDVLTWEGDAVITTTRDVACAVRVADCVPILLADPSSGAVGAVHAGWRGLVAGIVGAAVRCLAESAGHGVDLLAAIGPHIGPSAFEVGPDVAEAIAGACPSGCPIDWTRGPRPFADLRMVATAQLEGAGVRAERIDQVPGCTVTDPDFFSFRRDGPRSGRHLAAIVAREPA
jgi:polyphenol oxidase